MKKFYLIGQNISTSLSPLIHNQLFKMKNFKGQYSLYKQNYLPSIQQLKNQNISGLSITIPFKQSFGQYDKLFQSNKQQLSSKLIQRRVINTLYSQNQITVDLQKESKQNESAYKAANTDIFGVKQCLQDYLNNCKSYESFAIVIGGGGTAQVFFSYFQSKEVNMFVINRNVDKIKQIKMNYYPNISNIFPINLEPNICKENASKQCEKVKNIFIINTLPSLIFNQNKVKMPFQHILSQFNVNADISLMDVNYRNKTDFLKEHISSINNKYFGSSFTIKTVASGLDMLRWQAIQQNRLFCNESQYDKQTYENHYKYVKNLTYNIQNHL